MTSTAEAVTAFMQILGSAKESLKKILLKGEFDEYPDEKEMHCTARLAEMLNQYSVEIHSKCSENDAKNLFLLNEITVLQEAKAIGLPNFLPRTAFLTLLAKNIKAISSTPFEFVDKMYGYIENVVVSILMKHSENYPQLLMLMRCAAQNLVETKKKQLEIWVVDIIEMEKMTDYTCNTEYVSLWNKLVAQQNAFMEIVNDHRKVPQMKIDGYGDVDVSHLRGQVAVIVQEAFDLKMRLTAYWKVVLMRLVDCMALRLLFSVQNLVNKEMEVQIINEIIGPDWNGLERILDESPAIVEKRRVA
ncbi:hypothetical protein CASFOL_002368 [Castilleja foliolosa]|uniref:GED domain-containing protein n=1 Tax=Castilleja foliolosa TaxID=1961234 RepID=A0ABD3EG07_9LAMI